MYKGQGRNQRELMTHTYWEFRSREIIASPYPNHEGFSSGYPALSGKVRKHADSFSVARVQPRTSKGITDLLLLNLVRLNTACPSKKCCGQKESAHYLVGQSLVRYRNKPDKSLHQLRTAMHHHPPNQERALNLSILTVSGPGEFSRVGSN